ncbi:MAG: ABC transporter, substrate-binding protein (cluster 2, ribose/xylose/arabinose/galactose) [uncultured Thermomicrobiales bacterium]|uniref:ABC transporter, substrate-binding protein (Cluster 2, ribose/xylose/arabinose/galactose) n=1 Tax=uncultured Thermomicrobiales bacterium TaxID=1645740 RepID=A0A6J4UAK4_9BACT|nr:MAG: ABC transporter, substrate-binding protein (cluster 2, ribose/xylose/arabinose/galactose) [uncultured Thermomicrobiales bacterium]
MKKWVVGIALVLALVLGIGIWSRAGAGRTSHDNRLTVGVSLLTLTNPFFKEIEIAMHAEAAKHGIEVLVTSGEFDVARQRNQVNDFIIRDVDAIVLVPCDSRAIGTSIAEANRAGIPVLTADIAALSTNAKVLSHIATDNLGGGREAAKAMIEALDGRGKVAILDFPEVESVLLRTKGFEEVIRQHNETGPGRIEVVAKLPGGGAKDKSYKAAEDVIQAHPDLDGIFAINDPSALGAVAALEKAGRQAQVKVIGFDGMPEGRQAIREGKVYADPVQFPDRIGRTTIQTIAQYLAGEDVPAETLIPTALYRKADAEKDETLKP